MATTIQLGGPPPPPWGAVDRIKAAEQRRLSAALDDFSRQKEAFLEDAIARLVERR